MGFAAFIILLVALTGQNIGKRIDHNRQHDETINRSVMYE